jgi:hypothetical protein
MGLISTQALSIRGLAWGVNVFAAPNILDAMWDRATGSLDYHPDGYQHTLTVFYNTNNSRISSLHDRGVRVSTLVLRFYNPSHPSTKHHCSRQPHPGLIFNNMPSRTDAAAALPFPTLHAYEH